MNEMDIREFRQLMEESQDLQADAMRGMQAPLDDIVEVGRARRATREYREHAREGEANQADAVRRGLVTGGLGVLGLAGLWAAGARSAFAADNADVMTLQTAASLENLAVFTYQTALTLPYLKTSSVPIKTVAAFATMTMNQHAEHAKAFNAKAVALGGKEQTATDPKYTPIVQGMVPKLKAGGPADVVALAITLEDVATSTYVANISTVTDPTIRELFGTVAGVESQHLATLYAVQALLQGGGSALITLKATGGETDVAKLPAAAGSVGFPEEFKKTDQASPSSEGAVQ